MKSKLMSCFVVLIAISFVSQTNFILMLSSILIVFTFNSIVVSLVAHKPNAIDLQIHGFRLKLINSSVITRIGNFFNELSTLLSDFIQSKVNIDLSKAEKTLSEMPFCGTDLDIRSEFNVVSRLITDNYMDFWYESIGTDNKEFVIECRLILEKLFFNLFDRCAQKIDKHKFVKKFLVLIESHLNEIKSLEDLSALEVNETQRMDSIIERVLLLTATEEIVDVLPKQSPNSHKYSIYLMIKSMLTHSVFIPIVSIIADKKFIYKNLLNLITNSDLKVVDKEYQIENSLRIDEPLNLDFKEQIKSIDSIDCSHGQKNIAIHDQNLFMSQLSTSSHSTQDNTKASDFSEDESVDELIVEALEAEEEIDSKIISNLVISQTKETKELFGAPYILYLIEYDGLFRHEIDFPHDEDTSVQKFCLVRKTVSVYRRFSEFISLQKVLERNKAFKRLMKGLKKPTAIQITTQNLFAFAGSANTPLDASTIEFRRMYLQNFLQQLCCRKAILESPEFQQFLGYGSDGSIAFVNKADKILFLNIDKMFVRGVKGAISLMKTALPVEAQVGKIDPHYSQRPIPETERLTIRSIETKVDSDSHLHLENKINCWIKMSLEDNLDQQLDKKLINDNLCNESKLGTRTLGDGCEDPHELAFDDKEPDLESESKSLEPESKSIESSQIMSSINCLLLFITTNIELIKQIIFVKILSLAFGTTIDKFIDEVLTRLFTKDMFVRHIHSLHTAIWPEDEQEVQKQIEVQNDKYLDQTVATISATLKARSYAIGPYIGQIIDKLSIERYLSNTLSKFENSKTNKLFLYNFFELILDEIQ